MKRTLFIGCACFCAFVIGSGKVLADDASASMLATNSAPAMVSGEGRYGLFNALDHRSQYGLGAFPEPFLVDDSDLEVNEFRLDWLHTRLGDSSADVTTAELEKGFGNLTVELEVHYERDVDADEVTQGFDNVDLGARYPLFQYVNASGSFDTTFGVGFEAGIPTKSALSHNAELVPKIFNDTIVGNLSLQSIIGYSHLCGPGDDGGLDTFEYGFVLGYAIQHKVLPIPWVQQLIPVFELSGERELNNGSSGHNTIIGNAAFRLNMKAFGRIQPRLGLGFIFPIDKGGKEEVQNGVFTSLVFEY